MTAPPLLIRGARVLSIGGSSGAARGTAMRDLGVIERADVLVADGRIDQISEGALAGPAGCRTIEAEGRVLMPAFVDSHTHAMWAGERLDEWEQSLEGASYLEILESGGGIMSTVRAVREATQEQLELNLRTRLAIMLREGTTTVEVKSGYGLSTEAELKMLRAISGVAGGTSQTIVPTALIGHAIDREQQGFTDRTIGETLDAVHAEFPGVFVDAYCEEGAWSLQECRALFERGAGLGHPFRVHTDQFNELGMTEWACENGAVSVDHLEASSGRALAAVAASDTFGVLLPCSGFQVDGRYADGRALIDAGATLAIATNCNPGSAPTSSMALAIALAVRNCGLTPAEAIYACTRNAAALLGFEDRGFIAPGARADLILLRHTDERALAHEFGGNPVDSVICDGTVA